MPSKHALIVGVDKYCNLDKKYELSGCVNDAKLIKGVLRNKFDFDESHITELHNDTATRDSILAAMDSLADDIKKDDVVVFHFSGHGSRRTSPEPGEGSGKDSTIMPHDSGRNPLPNLDIADVEINAWLRRLAKKTRNISMTFDCCHSGTVTRDAFAATVRAVPDDTRSIEDMGIDVGKLPKSGNTATRGASDSEWLLLGNSYVVMSGCRDNEYSHEFTQQDGKEEIRNGALTHFLTNALTKAKPGTTYQDVFELAHQGVNSKFPTQNPQIEGAMGRELFGTKEIEPLRFIPVVSVDGDTVMLDGGAAHGIFSGSRWSVYPQGTKKTEGTKALGEVEITDVGALTSEAKLVAGKGKFKSGARCIEKAVSPEQFLFKVDLSEVPEKLRGELASGIDKSDLLVAAKSPKAADVCAYVLGPRTEAEAEGEHVPQEGKIDEPSWVVINQEGALTMPIHAVAEKNVIKLLVENLETNARYRNALQLDNPDSDLNAEFNIYARNKKDEWEKANGGDHVFIVGDRLGFEVVNHEDFPVFVSILDFGLDGKISLVYPPKTTSELIEPGATLKVAMGDRKLNAGFPKGFTGDHGRGALKAFITSDEADFRWLQQEGTRAAGGKKSSLRKQFEAAYNGPKTRDFSFDEEEQTSEQWTATSRSFEIRSK